MTIFMMKMSSKHPFWLESGLYAGYAVGYFVSKNVCLLGISAEEYEGIYDGWQLMDDGDHDAE